MYDFFIKELEKHLYYKNYILNLFFIFILFNLFL